MVLLLVGAQLAPGLEYRPAALRLLAPVLARLVVPLLVHLQGLAGEAPPRVRTERAGQPALLVDLKP